MTGTRTTYADIAFGPRVRARQEQVGAHLRITPPGDEPFRFDPRDRALIRSSDLFFLSTVTESGWPYVQHRGGPPDSSTSSTSGPSPSRTSPATSSS
ncbi:pyridoxamine 5'-phosphate oxidase family protein [Corynebacterium suedekumii]|nr:pyridoxamine 5'-phosphate oxidase family protein [Corynebacterium suedekumii]